jgi:hypothetical protein
MSVAVAGAQHTLARPPAGTTWLAVLYVALAATCIGFVIQAWAQAALSAATAAVIMTMEPVFAAVIATIAGGESIGVAGAQVHLRPRHVLFTSRRAPTAITSATTGWAHQRLSVGLSACPRGGV